MSVSVEVPTVKDSVHSFLRKNRRYIDGFTLEEEFGPSALRRVRELRSDGIPIQMRRIDGTFQYRLGR